MRLREIRLEPQRFVIVFDGAVTLPGIVEGVAAVFMAVGIGGLELDGLIEGFERGLHLAGLAEDFAAGAVGAGALRILGDDGVDFG